MGANGVEHRVGVAYAATSPAQVMDLALPPGDGPHPLLLWIHGGGWMVGSRSTSPFADLAADGVAVASMDHRTALAPYPAPFDDPALALAHIRDDAADLRVDPDRIVLAGFSSGAHLAAMAALAGDEPVAGLLTFAGPLDLRDLADVPGRGGEGAAALLGILVDCSPEECTERVAAVSPVTLVSATAPPILVQHGTDDPVVPFSVGQAFVDAATEVGADVTLDAVDGLRHDVRRTDAVRAFLGRVLGVEVP